MSNRSEQHRHTDGDRLDLETRPLHDQLVDHFGTEYAGLTTEQQAAVQAFVRQIVAERQDAH